MAYCEFCGIEHDGTFASGRFCNRRCSILFVQKNRSQAEVNEKIGLALKGRTWAPKIEKKCENCGKLMLVFVSHEKRFCDKKCATDFRSVNDKDSFERYRTKARFLFNIYDYPDHFDLDLIERYGWYSPANRKNNLNGISRDHILSVKDGYLNGIPPELIGHITNCRLVRHKENQKKHSKSSISIEEFYKKLSQWENGNPPSCNLGNSSSSLD